MYTVWLIKLQTWLGITYECVQYNNKGELNTKQKSKKKVKNKSVVIMKSTNKSLN